jgi:hypothetical protein
MALVEAAVELAQLVLMQHQAVVVQVVQELRLLLQVRQ